MMWRFASEYGVVVRWHFISGAERHLSASLGLIPAETTHHDDRRNGGDLPYIGIARWDGLLRRQDSGPGLQVRIHCHNTVPEHNQKEVHTYNKWLPESSARTVASRTELNAYST